MIHANAVPGQAGLDWNIHDDGCSGIGLAEDVTFAAEGFGSFLDATETEMFTAVFSCHRCLKVKPLAVVAHG